MPDHERVASIRTFIAADISESARAWAGTLQSELKAFHPSGAVTWVDPSRFHITLKFLGNVPTARLAELRGALRALWARWPLTIRLGGLGQFPEHGQPAVLWLGVTQGADALAELARAIDARLEPLGYAAQLRGFHAHLTLGRVKNTTPGNAAPARVPRTDASPPFAVDALTLYKSILAKSGPTYEALASLR